MNEHEHATLEVDYVDKKWPIILTWEIHTYETKRLVALRKNLTARTRIWHLWHLILKATKNFVWLGFYTSTGLQKLWQFVKTVG